jgi:CelD/BcsL family acetyltransferase involved in cellulose biosynthesis
LGGGVHGLAAITIARALAPIERDWRSFEATAAGHVFQTFAFVSTWVETVGRERGVEPLIVIGRDVDDGILFILPFGITRRWGRRELGWLGGEHADYNGGLFDRRFLARAERDRLAAAVVGLLKGEADYCNLSRQPATIDGLANPFATPSAAEHPDRRHETWLGTSWDAYYRAKRDATSRRHDRAKLKRLESLGEVCIKTQLSALEIDRAMTALFAEKERHLAERGAGALFCSEAVKRFYRELARLAYPDGPCHVATLECAGEIAAVNWGLIRGNRYYYVMHAFAARSAAARYSPGRLLMYALMQWCIERGVEVFDFTIGDEDFKEQWCEVRLPLCDTVTPLTAWGTPFAHAIRTGTAVKRFIKARPALHSAAQAIRRRLPPMRERPVPG